MTKERTFDWPNPDATLLARAEKFHRLHDAAGQTPNSVAGEAETDRLLDQAAAVMDEIAVTPATNRTGIAAKRRVVEVWNDGAPDGYDMAPDAPDPTFRVLLSITADMGRLAD